MSSRYDFGAAIAGLVFMALGGAFLVDRLDVVDLRPTVVLAIGLIGLGAAALVGSLVGGRR